MKRYIAVIAAILIIALFALPVAAEEMERESGYENNVT